MISYIDERPRIRSTASYISLTHLLDTFLNFHPGLAVTMLYHCLRHVAKVPRERAQLKISRMS